MNTKTKSENTQKHSPRTPDNDVVPNLVIAAPPTVHPLRLKNQLRRWFVRERAIKRLEKQVDAIKAELKPLLPLGETVAGDYRVVKSKVEPTPIPAYVRAGYETIKVSEK